MHWMGSPSVQPCVAGRRDRKALRSSDVDCHEPEKGLFSCRVDAARGIRRLIRKGGNSNTNGCSSEYVSVP